MRQRKWDLYGPRPPARHSARPLLDSTAAQQELRCALGPSPELARLARAHNDANVLTLPGRFIASSTAVECLQAFMETPFEGGRHQRRIDKIEG